MPTVKANGIDMYYEISGSGPPLTLIAGLGCSARHWQWMLPRFTQSFRVITFDNRGVGRTAKPEGDYSTGLFAQDVHALLNALQVAGTHVFGFSMGGMIAQQFALMYPQETHRLVLGCTMPSFSHIPPAPRDLERMQQSQLLSLEESVKSMMSLFFTPDFFTRRPDMAAQVQEMMMLEKTEQGSDAFFRQLEAAMNHTTVAEAQNITAPTLVISGDADPVAPINNSRFLERQIPDSRLVELKGTAHAFWIERCDAAADIITAFLNDSGETAGQ